MVSEIIHSEQTTRLQTLDYFMQLLDIQRVKLCDLKIYYCKPFVTQCSATYNLNINPSIIFRHGTQHQQKNFVSDIAVFVLKRDV